jgi:ribosomal protein S18 acetylase RimI-like enzyme
MKYSILPISEEHIDGFRSAVDSVAREHLFLALLEAPPMEAVREFVLTNIRFGNPQFVALANNDVVGWCDIIPGTRPVFRHSGVLGMGVIREFRHQGIGTALIKATLDAARSTGLTRIELTVRVDNTPAIRLYEKFGFAVVARLGHHMFVDGEYIDSFLMSLLM